MGKCALIDAECPRTADRSAKRYCPNYKTGIPSVSPTHGFCASPTFTGCYLEIQDVYAIAMARDACHSAAAFNEARNAVLGAGEGAQGAHAQLATIGLVLLGGALRQERTAIAAGEQPGALPAPGGD